MTRPQSEAKANARLISTGFETFYPFSKIRRRRKMPLRDVWRIEWIAVPYWPRYLLAEALDPTDIYTINETDYVSRVLSIEGKAMEVPVEIVNTLQALAADDGFMGKTDKVERPRMKRGQKFRFHETSPWYGYTAVVEVDNGRKINVSFEQGSSYSRFDIPPSMVGELVRS